MAHTRCYEHSDDAQGWAVAGLTFALYAASLAVVWSPAGALLAGRSAALRAAWAAAWVAVRAAVQVRMVVCTHECAHLTLFKSALMNLATGRLGALLVGVNYDHVGRMHAAAHHGHLGLEVGSQSAGMGWDGVTMPMGRHACGRAPGAGWQEQHIAWCCAGAGERAMVGPWPT